MKFSYRRYRVEKSKAFPKKTSVFYPTVNLTLINSKTKQAFPNYAVLVDSGASHCVFHAGIGEAIGIDVRSGKKAPMRGVTVGEGEQFFHKIVLVIEGNKVESYVGFSYDLRFPFGLLGQEGFFDKFRVCFDFPKKEFEITPKTR
jgi:hypothetical protein